jgi:uncharacterized repeat protein (TIGR03803 family)
MTTYKNQCIKKSAWQKPRLPLLFFYVITMYFQLSTFSSFAQYTKLLDFGSKANGYLPYSSLVSDGTFLYGVTSDGGSNDFGTIYKIKLDGTGFVKLQDFSGTNGANPYGSLKLVGTVLYGMTKGGGVNGQGIIFKINSDGTGFTNLFDFSYTTTGAYPYGSLISDGTFLYGMTYQGGSSSYGTVFKIMPDGTNFSKLIDFDGAIKGGYPNGSLILEGSFLYGMTSQGGSNDLGAVFKINKDGTGFLKLINFTGTANGASPWGSLISDGAFLYGMTLRGGLINFGTIFKIKSDATGFTKLLDFDNSTKGAYPKGSLVFSADLTFVYGATTDYGVNGRGTIFKIKTDGTGFVKLLDSDVGTNGPYPEGTLLTIGTSIYGAKSGGGAGTAPFPPGTIFKINSDGTGYAKLFSFGIEGSNPSGSLYSDGTFHYGMTSTGGLLNYGTLFKIKPDGTGFVRLLDFTGINNGSRPTGSLISDGTFLYGMTSSGGTNDLGVIFKIKPDGSSYVKLLDFDPATNGASAQGSLFFDGTYLYGLTAHGGPGFYGNIFKIKPDGTGFTNLLNFDDTSGAYPNGSLISDGAFLYGTTYQGSANGWGGAFKIKPDGTGFSTLLDFDNTTNGSNPKGDLFYDGAFLYGMTSNGPAGKGSIFKIKPDGTGYAKLKDFGSGGSEGSLISDGTFLYGMTYIDGSLSKGTLFKIKPDGTDYTILTDFNDGSNPLGSLILYGGVLYGMTNGGGANNLGTLFKSTSVPFVSIADFIPAEGVIGTYVTISGTGFDPIPANNIVKFNNTNAIVVSGTTTTLTAIVPVGATTGPISVTSGTTDTSASDFTVTTQAVMINVTVKNCNFSLLPPTYTYTSSHGDMAVETFVPVNPADKVKVTFSTFNVSGGDVLYVYDGPTSASPLLATLVGITPPPAIVATGPGGELTFVYKWGDGTTIWNATIRCQSLSGSPTINLTTQPSDFAACQGDVTTFSAAATGTTNIAYQWQFSSTLTGTYNDISNSGGYSNVTTGLLAVNTTGNFGAGFYRCKVNGDLAATVFTNAAQLMIKTTGCTIPVITAKSLATQIGGIITLDLVPLVKTVNNNLDLTSLAIISPPVSGGKASINSSGVLTIDYTGLNFSGAESITIKACDLNKNCAQQIFNIEVTDMLPSEIIVYNAVSPEGKNPILHISAIEGLSSKVSIYNRWGDEVFSISDYDNKTRAFSGVTNDGSKLPTGTYFYKIILPTVGKTLTGFLSLKY